MELLLKAGAEKDAQNDKGQTAIHITVGKGHVDTTRLLLAHGVSVNIKVQLNVVGDPDSFQIQTFSCYRFSLLIDPT